MKIIECVPNFSEGCDQNSIMTIAEVFDAHPAVHLVNFSSDADHNRSVFTFLGRPADVLKVALAAAGRALKVIDMCRHQGVHPRLGAIDVVPFIPLLEATMNDAVEIAHIFGRELYERYGVPVYFYGRAALNPGRRELADIRRGGYEALAQKISGPEGVPDIGKAEFNARSGATVVGAREPLVAYNINLASDDLQLARKIASRIREKNGGLKYVRAIGVFLKSRNLVQVSINLTDYKKTPLKTIYDLVQAQAYEEGVEILETELIGLTPKAAFGGATPEYLKIRNFNENCLLETHLKQFSR